MSEDKKVESSGLDVANEQDAIFKKLRTLFRHMDGTTDQGDALFKRIRLPYTIIVFATCICGLLYMATHFIAQVGYQYLGTIVLVSASVYGAWRCFYCKPPDLIDASESARNSHIRRTVSGHLWAYAGGSILFLSGLARCFVAILSEPVADQRMMVYGCIEILISWFLGSVIVCQWAFVLLQMQILHFSTKQILGILGESLELTAKNLMLVGNAADKIRKKLAESKATDDSQPQPVPLPPTGDADGSFVDKA